MRPFHRSHAPLLLLLALFLGSALSGCLGDGDADTTTDGASPGADADAGADLIAPDGRDLGTELVKDDEVPVPVWRQGDWWGVHFYFGSQGGEGRHIDTIVTEAGPTGYHLATNDQQAAKIHALRDYPVLGPIGANDLSSTAFGGAWDWFHFPMTDGATWRGEVPNIAFDVLPEGQVPIQFTATYTDSIEVEGKKVPGYTIDGTIDDGTLLVQYTYAPSVRWMTSATIYDIDPGQDPIEFSMTLMGYGRDWTGTYYDNDATILVDNFDGAGFTNLPTEGGEPFAQPSPHVAFTVSDDATYLFGYIFNGAIAGIRETVLVPPEGEPRRYEAVGAPMEGSGVLVDEAAMPGQWQLFTTGAGALTLSEVLLVEIIERTGSL